MTRVHVFGASGYAGAECVRILSSHPSVELGVIESNSSARELIGKQFPQLRRIDRKFDPPGAVEREVKEGDVVIMGGQSGAAKELAPKYLQRGARVIDLSQDFRLQPSEAVYGLPERYRDQIAKAKIVANPGCYPTAVLLATLPLASATRSSLYSARGPSTPQDDKLTIIVDAKSGITGAGRTPAVSSMFAEVYGEIRPYGLQGHRHEPEMLQELQAAGLRTHLVFTPHVVPIARGLLTDAYCIMPQPVKDDAVRATFTRFYAGSPFVRVLEEDAAPSISSVVNTNDAEISVSVHGNVVRVICAIDNLGKGAAGQAVQNLNIMLGLPEETGLAASPSTRFARSGSGACAERSRSDTSG